MLKDSLCVYTFNEFTYPYDGVIGTNNLTWSPLGHPLEHPVCGVVTGVEQTPSPQLCRQHFCMSGQSLSAVQTASGQLSTRN